MSDVEKLKHLDPDEVCKRLYITPKIFNYLIEKKFQKLGNRTKVLGLISILERAYGLDLSELRDSANKYFLPDEVKDIVIEKERIEFEEATKKRPFNYKWLLVFVLVIGAGLYFLNEKYDGGWKSFITHLDENEKEKPLQNIQEHISSSRALSATSKQEQKSSVESVVVTGMEQNSTQENETNVSNSTASLSRVTENSSVSIIENNTTLSQYEQKPEQMVEDVKAVIPSISIIPKMKIWIGVIYLDNYEHKQLLTSSPFEINTSRDQLIVTGHGFFRVEQNGELSEFNSTKKQRFIYRAGMLEKIDAQTFRHYNRGKDW